MVHGSFLAESDASCTRTTARDLRTGVNGAVIRERLCPGVFKARVVDGIIARIGRKANIRSDEGIAKRWRQRQRREPERRLHDVRFDLALEML